MLPRLGWAGAATAALALSCAFAQTPPHAFSVQDDIEMCRFSDPFVQPSVSGSEIARPSPDGRHVAIVLTRGHLKTDLIESRILVFDLRAVQHALINPPQTMPTPKTIASIQGAPSPIENEAYGAVIKDLRWSADSQSLYFRGFNRKGEAQLYSVHRDGTHLRQLSPAGRDVDQFDVAGETIVYDDAGAPKPKAAGVPINRNAVDITGETLLNILFPEDSSQLADRVYSLHTTLARDVGTSDARRVPSYQYEQIPAFSAVHPFRISPDGRYLVDLEPPAAVPDSWARYAPAPGFEHLRLNHPHDHELLRVSNVLRPLAYTLIDLRSGRRSLLVDGLNARNLAWNEDANKAAWSPRSSEVALTNTFLPSASDSTGDILPCAVAVVTIADRHASCVLAINSSLHVLDVAFADSDTTLIVSLRSHTGETVHKTFHGTVGHWAESAAAASGELVQVAAAPRSPKPPEVFVRQSLNDPPKLFARDPSGNVRLLYDPNPQLRAMTFGEASPFTWTDTAGRHWDALLLKPVGYDQGKRYPAVLQMYNYVDGVFVTDGLYPTAFAARELASAGFVVLQIRKKPDTLSEQDPITHIEGYRSAIAALDHEGLIDPKRVGVVGFSWTCWYVTEALVKAPSLFKAATIADGFDNGYMDFKLWTVGDLVLRDQMTRIRGSAPFGHALQHWVDVAPTFHADRVTAAVRMEAISRGSVLAEWEFYSSLELLGKPVDLVSFPQGTHVHQLPQERYASQQGNVDWMRFWLKDEEDPAPAKRPQYERWEAMRKEQQEGHLP